MKTEDEARKCWCPFVRAIGTGAGMGAAINTILAGKDLAPNRDKARCCASECMAWRWVDTGTSVEGSLKDHHWRPVGETDSKKRVCADDRGYCGLAGKP